VSFGACGAEEQEQRLTIVQVFLAFLKLGLTSFGGPVAHLGYFRNEFIVRRKCLSEQAYADLVALCQFLPGPASSQVGMGIGISQAGMRGALAAWAGFTLPSALLLILLAYAVGHLNGTVAQLGWLHGLKVVSVAVVAQAIRGMAQALCPDRPRGTVAIFAAVLVLALPGSPGQLLAILMGALAGLFFLKSAAPPDQTALRVPIGRGSALCCLVIFLVLLLGAPLMLALAPSHALALCASFYRTGSLVFGGGHVVLPLLQAEVVTPGWVSKDLFLAGYGAAQAVPGPLFTFAAFLGAVMRSQPRGWLGGMICLAAIFLPSFLLLVGILPFWERLRRMQAVRCALMGVNAAVVGLLLAVFYDPVWTSSIGSAKDIMLALACYGLLALWETPPWLVVAVTALISGVLAAL